VVVNAQLEKHALGGVEDNAVNDSFASRSQLVELGCFVGPLRHLVAVADTVLLRLGVEERFRISLASRSGSQPAGESARRDIRPQAFS
jgi:hypothetical protein